MISAYHYTDKFSVAYSLHSISKFVIPYVVISIVIIKSRWFYWLIHLLPCIITIIFTKSELFSDVYFLLEPLLTFII